MIAALPYTEEALRHVVERVGIVQDILGRRLVLENVSSYVSFAASTLTEWELLRAWRRTRIASLCSDVNNIHVSCVDQ